MANFTYNWNNGDVTTVALPNETGFNCDYTSPSSRMLNFAAQIVANANNSQDLHEVEAYCIQAQGQLSTFGNVAQTIKDVWDQKEIDCANGSGLCWVCRCRDKGAYCYMTENQLEAAYYNWQNTSSSIFDQLNALIDIQIAATEQIYTDLEQAEALALLNQLQAETNNVISVTAYQNESRELDLQKSKASSVFLPIIIVLLILGAGFYYMRKK